MNISIDDTADTEAAYDGSIVNDSVITIGNGLTSGLSIKGLKIYRTDKGESWLSN